VTAAATPSDELQIRYPAVGFLVEDVERCQANVCDFFLTECDFVILKGVQRRAVGFADRRCGHVGGQ
jgi:hypothetical protein